MTIVYLNFQIIQFDQLIKMFYILNKMFWYGFGFELLTILRRCKLNNSVAGLSKYISH